MNERFIIIEGLQISYAEERNASDTWIVCLHGLQSNKEVFHDLLAKPLFRNYSLLAIDFIGFGNSSKPKDFSYDIQQQAHLVEKLFSLLHVDRCHVIGHSMGGMVGTLLLKQLKEKVLSFVNMEGNLVAEDCGANLSIVEMSFDECASGGYEKFKYTQAQSNDRGTAARM